MVRLDTNAIRHKSLKEYRKTEQALEKLKSQLKHFREQDAPGFRIWMHQTFGSLLTRQRELAQVIHDKQALLGEIADLANRYRLSNVAAYRKIQWRHTHPEEAQAEDLRFEEGSRRHQKELDEQDEPDERSDHIYEHTNDGFDDNFTAMPDETWDIFSELFETMTGYRLPPRSAKSLPNVNRSARDVYRTIVRQLHPDLHGAMSESRKSLWHEAQEAYRRRDVAALYNVLARCDNGAAVLGQYTPVSLIHQMTAQLLMAIKSARSEIRRMKTDPAWNYEKRALDSRYSVRIRADLQDAIKITELELRSLDAMLAQLESQANRPARQNQTRRRRPPPSNPMEEFLF